MLSEPDLYIFHNDKGNVAAQLKETRAGPLSHTINNPDQRGGSNKIWEENPHGLEISVEYV